MSKSVFKSDIRFPMGQISYPVGLFSPLVGGKLSPNTKVYSCDVLYSKKDEKAIEFIKNIFNEVAKEQWGDSISDEIDWVGSGKCPDSKQFPVKDGDIIAKKKPESHSMYAGHYYIHITDRMPLEETRKPQVIKFAVAKGERAPITDPKFILGGDFVVPYLSLGAYDVGSQGIYVRPTKIVWMKATDKPFGGIRAQSQEEIDASLDELNPEDYGIDNSDLLKE